MAWDAGEKNNLCRRICELGPRVGVVGEVGKAWSDGPDATDVI